MRLSLDVGYWGAGRRDDVPLVREADRLGYHSVWTSEAYGSDAVSTLAWLGAHTSRIALGTAVMQMPARSPAMTAMTAATLDHLSEGRFLLGLGMSGPQVVEGWHGTAYGRPLVVTREYVDLVRQALARERPVRLEGDAYRVPYDGPGSTGLGRPLKLIVHPRRAAIPVYLAAIGPRNVELAGEIADGWLPIFVSPQQLPETLLPSLDAGLARRGRTRADVDVAACVAVAVGDDLQACYDAVRPTIALYVGGMGARGRNFYNELATRYGFGAAARTVQELYLEGHRADAIAAVPDALVDEVSLVGPPERVRDRLEAWTESAVTNLVCMTGSSRAVRTLAELLL